MFKLNPVAASIAMTTVLAACMAPFPKMEFTVKPHEEARNSPGTRLDPYELGRYYQSTGKRGLAMEAYVQAIKLKQRDLDARSALAELYSSEGRFSEAELLLREVIAQSPASAYLHNNLGYVFFLQGNDVAAIRELRTALTLDPRHEWARNNLKLAETMLDRRMASNIETHARRAETTVKAFEVWGEVQARDAKMEPALTTALGTVAEAARPQTPAAAPKAAEVARILNRPVARKPEMKMALEIGQPRSRAGVELANLERNRDAHALSRADTVIENYLLEVSNGNGVTGFAKRVSQILVRQGIPVHGLTNQVPYRQVITEIHYRDGFERQAEQLKNGLLGYAIVGPASAPLGWSDLRVVLGKDITTHITEIDAARPALAAMANGGKKHL
jgi:Tfp pilus assembly protein PilF